jgi:hypothetical protein
MIKMNPVVLELPDDKKAFIIDCYLKGVGWMAKVYSLKHFILS